MKRKEVDDVLGGRDAWANVDKAEGVCFPDICTQSIGFLQY